MQIRRWIAEKVLRVPVQDNSAKREVVFCGVDMARDGSRATAAWVSQNENGTFTLEGIDNLRKPTGEEAG
jgi:hypothetical protein